MRQTALLFAVAVVVANAATYGQPAARPSAIGDFLSICDAYAESDVIFLARAQPPITFRISEAAKAETEKARQQLFNIQRDVAHLRASLDPQTWREREFELATRLVEAEAKFEEQEVMYRLGDDDLTLSPMVVEQTLRGLPEPTVMVLFADPSMSVEPGELYVIGGRRSRDRIPPAPELASYLPFVEYVYAWQVTHVAMATEHLRFLSATVQGATIVGELKRQSYELAGAPLGGVRILVSSDGQTLETVTTEDGSFIVSGLEPGPVVVRPLLSSSFAIVNREALTFTLDENWCKPLSLAAERNGRVRGRILAVNDKSLDNAELRLRTAPGDDFNRWSAHDRVVRTRPQEDGTFEFVGVPPGVYLLTAVLQKTEDGKTRYFVTHYPGTTDVNAAVPIIVGDATQHDGINFIVIAD